MSTVSYQITDEKTGEKLSNFALSEGDLVIADRAYGTINGVAHCINSAANFILRLRTNCFAVWDENGEKVDIAARFAKLGCGEAASFKGLVHMPDGGVKPIRICAHSKNEAARCESEKRLRHTANKKGYKLADETIQFNEFVVVATSLPDNVTDAQVMDAYR
ncbi:MAG: hypothetical protein LBK46_04815 [Oscillospiraceae bacterium]|nr:hypothetical protein [Oscillospiraceae bacterium]